MFTEEDFERANVLKTDKGTRVFSIDASVQQVAKFFECSHATLYNMLEHLKLKWRDLEDPVVRVVLLKLLERTNGKYEIANELIDHKIKLDEIMNECKKAGINHAALLKLIAKYAHHTI